MKNAEKLQRRIPLILLLPWVEEKINPNISFLSETD